jgi:DNA-binding transcriptional ArsR family regulator
LAAAVLGLADAETLSRQFAALADPVRLRLLSLLATAEGGAVCACDLVEPVGKTQPTVSHHLKVLTDAGLVTSESAAATCGMHGSRGTRGAAERAGAAVARFAAACGSRIAITKVTSPSRGEQSSALEVRRRLCRYSNVRRYGDRHAAEPQYKLLRNNYCQVLVSPVTKTDEE